MTCTLCGLTRKPHHPCRWTPEREARWNGRDTRELTSLLDLPPSVLQAMDDAPFISGSRRGRRHARFICYALRNRPYRPHQAHLWDDQWENQ